MKTYFASPERKDNEELNDDLKFANNNEVISGLLSILSGLLAILNENRQILAVNHKLLELLGGNDLSEILGLRPGEALKCINAQRMPGGCGTSEYCVTCGAVIAIVTCMAENTAVTRMCVLKTAGDDLPEELYLKVTAYPIIIEEHRFTAIFIQDVTEEQRWATIEKVFFHDLKNLLTGLIGSAQFLRITNDQEEIERVGKLALRVADEVKIQQYLLETKDNNFSIQKYTVKIQDIVTDLCDFIKNHPIADLKRFEILVKSNDDQICTEPVILTRVLNNMVINAFEAIDDEGIVYLTINADNENFCFTVSNEGFIPESISKRIFQKNFSTKANWGRGLGTYSIKLLGEEILGGKVGFETSPDSGTEFWLKLSK